MRTFRFLATWLYLLLPVGCTVHQNFIGVPISTHPVAGGQSSRISTYSKVVAAGTTANMDRAFLVNPDCTSRGLMQVWVAQPPAHGTTRVFQINDYPVFPNTPRDYACRFIKLPGIAVEYTPEAGYTGPDTIRINRINGDNQEIDAIVSIIVVQIPKQPEPSTSSTYSY